jgi:hypothetical protein
VTRRIKRKNSAVQRYAEQGKKCVYCCSKMTLTLGFTNTATIDHITPTMKINRFDDFTPGASSKNPVFIVYPPLYCGKLASTRLCYPAKYPGQSIVSG